MSAEFPFCPICRVKITPGVNVMFRVDGRVEHVDCPPVACVDCGTRDEPSHRRAHGTMQRHRRGVV